MNIHESVLDTIKKGQVAMRPKWHFVLRAVLAIVGGVILVLSLLYLASFIVFVLRQTGVSRVPAFGFRGWYVFFISLPWLLIALSLVFIIILEILVRHYAFAYRRPLLYSVIGIVAVVFMGAYLISTTQFHPLLFNSAERGHLPFAGPLYRAFGEQQFRNIHPGRVIELMPSGFIMEGRRGERLRAIISPATRIPLNANLRIGAMVMVFGDSENDGVVRALGVRVMP